MILSAIDLAKYFHPPIVKQAINAYPNGKSGGQMPILPEHIVIMQKLAHLSLHKTFKFLHRFEIGICIFQFTF
jgi:hypothetical protein